MLLAIDAGNTNVVFAVHDGREWRGRWRIATRADRTSDEYAVWLLALFGHCGLKPGDIDRLTQRNGGTNNAYTSEDITNYHFDFGADRWEAALEIEADEVLMGKNGVDGVYTADPNVDPSAVRLESLTYDEAITRNIRVMDQTAFSLCRDNNVSMRVFGMQGEGSVTRAILGEDMGTLITV